MLALPRRISAVSCLCLTLASAVCPPAIAQFAYDLTHTFSWTPAPTFPPSVLEVTGRQFTHAYVREFGHIASAVNPAQGAAFDPFGVDRFSPVTAIIAPAGSNVFNRNGTTRLWNPVDTTVTPIGAGGIGVDIVSNILPGPSAARAESQIEVAPFSLLGPVTGFVHTEGFTTKVGAARLNSFAYGAVTIRPGRIKAGKITWGSKITTSSFGSTDLGPVAVADPIWLEAFDPDTNQSLLAKLLSVEFDPGDGQSQLFWDSQAALFQLNAAAAGSDTEFTIDLPGLLTDDQGVLHIVTKDGVVVSTQNTGIFAGLSMPAIGSPAAFSLPLGGFDFNYFIPFGGDRLDSGLLLFGGVETQAVPEPSGMVFVSALCLSALWWVWRRRWSEA